VTLHHNFGNVHDFGVGSASNCPCTALASCGDERIATVGEDGCLVVLALETVRSRHDTVYRIGLTISSLRLIIIVSVVSVILLVASMKLCC